MTAPASLTVDICIFNAFFSSLLVANACVDNYEVVIDYAAVDAWFRRAGCSFTRNQFVETPFDAKEITLHFASDEDAVLFKLKWS